MTTSLSLIFSCAGPHRRSCSFSHPCLTSRPLPHSVVFFPRSCRRSRSQSPPLHSLRRRAPMIQSLSPARCTAWGTLPTFLPSSSPSLPSACPRPLRPSPSTWLLHRRPASIRHSQAKAHGPLSTSSSCPCSIANNSGSNCKSGLPCAHVPLFQCSLLQTDSVLTYAFSYSEDLNQLVKRHISAVVSVAPGKAVATLEHDTFDLIATGMVTLNAELSGVEEEKLVPRVVETWSFFWSRVLPYLEGVRSHRFLRPRF